MSNRASTDENGRGFTVQTESPCSANLYETRGFLPRSRKTGDGLATLFGGRWQYVPGHCCRGGWSVEADTPEALALILRRTEIPVTVYLYPGSEVPEAFRSYPTYTLSERGYYETRIA